MMSSQRRALATATVLTTAVGLLASCSVGGGGSGDRDDPATSTKTVVVATHDSWNMPKEVLRAFTDETGYTARISPNGDAGQLTNKLVLTKGSPIADMAYGIDNTFASRAVDEGVLVDHDPPNEPASSTSYALTDPVEAAQLTPVDFGDVCVNIDDVWFRTHERTPPRTLDDLADPAYKGLFVTPGAASSSPGLAFLLATIAKYGDGWPAYWKKLMANDTKLTSGWSDAYEVDFTAGGGKGDRPIVLSYASSPPFTIPEGGRRPTTSSLPETCFRQVEYAGVLKGARNPEGAKAFVDFMTQRRFQEALPDNMYVFPVDEQATLPPVWAKFAKPAPKPFTVPPAEIAKNRDAWLREWGDITSR
jgi:thiamine transport system substrate-binding protein